MRFGSFDKSAREYVITDPRTPVKWINYIGSRQFGGFVDQTGGALLCRDDPTVNRITKYIQQMPASDFKGETLYLRVRVPGGYRLFSPFFVPTLEALEHYECHVGLGYTRVLSSLHGLSVEVTIFVPMGADCELRSIRIHNESSVALEVDAIPVVEFSHPDAVLQLTNADWVPQTMQCRAAAGGERIILVQYPFMLRDTRLNYFGSNLPVSSFETDRRRLLGDNEYGTFRAPLSLLQPELSSTEALRGDNVAALMHHLGRLAPGETRWLVTQLGQAPDLAACLSEIDRYCRPEVIEREKAHLAAFWDEYLSALQVATPDPLMDAMLNVHTPCQCYVAKTWSRYLSTYQTGVGSRGIGIRDSFQDVMSVVASVPAEARQFILTLLSFQEQDGSSIHQFNPLTMEGSAGDSLEMQDRPHYYSDDHLWGFLAVCAYLKETADFPFLETSVPFYSRSQVAGPEERGTVLEHLRRSLAFTRRDTGQHGLPLLGFADWNDTVNLPRGAESLFAANLYGRAMLEAIGLFEHLNMPQEAADQRLAYEEMQARVESEAWDGAWYVQYFDHHGRPLGSSANYSGQISLNAQSWSVLSGFAAPERGRQAMQSAFERLNTRFGLKLSAPGFNGYDPVLGGVSTYPPGAKENGGVFLHPNAWAVMAEAMLGNGDRAYQYYAQINPSAKNDHIEVYECEPYVYAQNILGDEHPQFGLGRNSWLTGTASWCYQAATQWILGVRPEYAGLRVDPCIPAHWNGFSMVRRFRGHTYHMMVHNPEHVCRGVVELRLDGLRLADNLAVPSGNPGAHSLEVWLGN